MSQISQVPESRRAILTWIKHQQSSTIAQLAERLGMTGEAVRQQLIQLQKEGWITTTGEREPGHHHSGRPAAHYRLTPDGDHLFPKKYDSLLIAILDAVGRIQGESLVDVLEIIIESHVAQWEARLQGCSFDERLEAMKDLYMENDSFARIDRSADGSFRLVECNCPFLNAAVVRPELCRISVETLRRVLGTDVRRDETIRDGNGHCVFRIGAPAARQSHDH